MHLLGLLLSLIVAEAAEPIRLPVRVHLIASDAPALDSASTSEAALRERFAFINKAFAPAGIVWEIERVVVDRPGAESAYRAAMADHEQRKAALNALRSGPGRLGPEGFDLYVVAELGSVGIGGAYQCAAGEPAGFGAAFVATRSKSGRSLPTRKWAHELGHALGLRHTPCASANSERLMMSGKCEVARGGRVGFTAEEIDKMRAQAAKGHAAPCSGKR